MKTTANTDTKELRRRSGIHLLEGLFIAAMVHGMLIGGLTAVSEYFVPEQIERPYPKERNVIIIDRGLPPLPKSGASRTGRTSVIIPAIPVLVREMADAAPETLLINEPVTTWFGTGEPGDASAGEGVADGSGSGSIEAEREPEPFTPVEREPVALSKPTPVYPELAMRAGVEGTVYIKMWVGRDGVVKRADIVKSTSAIFDESAVNAAQRWLFSPAVMNNGPVSVWVTVPFRFRLH